MSTSARIAGARDKVDSLKLALQRERTRIDDNSGLAVDESELVSIGVRPRVRRTLKGHFGKGYSLHWSGNG